MAALTRRRSNTRWALSAGKVHSPGQIRGGLPGQDRAQMLPRAVDDPDALGPSAVDIALWSTFTPSGFPGRSPVMTLKTRSVARASNPVGSMSKARM
jgi:hypothetical protein